LLACRNQKLLEETPACFLRERCRSSYCKAWKIIFCFQARAAIQLNDLSQIMARPCKSMPGGFEQSVLPDHLRNLPAFEFSRLRLFY
jgi:hypothetical protein